MYFKTVGNALFCALESLSLLIGTQAYALLSDSVNKEDPTTRIGAIMGLGLAYAGSQREEVRSNIHTLGGVQGNILRSLRILLM